MLKTIKFLFVVSLTPVILYAEPDPDFYVERRSYGTARETEPPRYVKHADETWLKNYSDIKWLDLGLEYRFRYEYRNNDFRRPVETIDNPILHRTKFYFAAKEALDPLRFTVEYQDSRRRNSQFEPDDRDINHHEFIQSYAELYFKETLQRSKPLSIKAGRMAFEQIDRRLIARNEWRNTTNTFQGLRTTWGKKEDPWQVDLFNLQPIDRLEEKFDRDIESQWFHGLIIDWRRWSDIVTLTPYYLQLRQDRDKIHQSAPESSRVNRLIHTLGLRAYGLIGETGFDYDFNLIRQFGDHAEQDHEAYAYVFETGYSAEHQWKPRVSASIGVATGDKDPNDGKNQRFERLFGFARPWSNNDYFQMENIVTPKLRFELEPYKDLKIDAGYSWYYLESSKDRWNNANLRDPSGQSGKDVGEEVDLRIRYPLLKPHIALNLGYAYFTAGRFTKATSFEGRDDFSHFFYTELTFQAF